MDGSKRNWFQRMILPIQRLPLGFHYFWGRVFTWVARDVVHYRSDVVMANIARSFPDRKYRELKDVYDGFYRHLGEVFAETMWFGGSYGRPGRLRKSGFCHAENEAELVRAYEERPSVMVLASHFGNWEIMGGFYEYFDRDTVIPDGMGPECTTSVFKHLASPFWNKFMVGNRTAPLQGCDCAVESREMFRYALMHRNEKRVYIFPTDQHPYKGVTSVEIPEFMHQKTKVMIGGAALAHKLGMAVFYMSIDREEKGHYRMSFRKICDDASTMEPAQIMSVYYGYLQESVNADPENYLWSHKRWK